MKLSVPNTFRANADDQHLQLFRWHRLQPETVRWEDDEIGPDLVGLGLASIRLCRWIEDESRFLMSDLAYSRELYEPLEAYPELFKLFSSLDGSEESFVGFARRFGKLGVQVLTVGGELKEPFCVWRLLWRHVSWCSRLIDLTSAARVAELKRFVQIDSRGDVKIIFPESHEVPRPPGWGMELLTSTAEGRPWPLRPDIWAAIERAPTESARLRMAARFWVQTTANIWMAGHMFDEISVICRVVAEEAGRAWRLRVAPNSLAAALWFQVARALEGDVIHKQCKAPNCRKWFVVSSDRAQGKRRDAEYCGDPRCRKEVFRAKHRKRAKGRDSKVRRPGRASKRVT